MWDLSNCWVDKYLYASFSNIWSSNFKNEYCALLSTIASIFLANNVFSWLTKLSLNALFSINGFQMISCNKSNP